MEPVEKAQDSMPYADLHCHSTASDGLLSPTQLLHRANGRGLKALALTDHDDVSGLEEARAAAAELGIALIDGVEISVTWRGHTIHVVGLGINPTRPNLIQGLASVRASRAERARRIAAELEKVGISGSLEGAYGYAENPQLIGRTHFARFLVEQGYCRDVKAVFRRYLARGRPGYVSHQWARLSDAVTWITGSGGLAVIAHPGRYPLEESELAALFSEFVDLGGQGVEVVSGSHTPEHCALFARYAQRYGLKASAGSDFHGPGEGRFDLGQIPELPSGCDPIARQLEALGCIV